MSGNELFKRYSFFIVGLFFSALGIVLITKAGLGTSPISSVPYVLSFMFPMTFGEFTFIVNMILLAGQIIILRRNFNKIQLLQIPMTIIFSFFIDMIMFLLAVIHPSFYPLKIVALFSGTIALGIGIALQVRANVVMLSGEGLVCAIAYATAKEFGHVKTVFDISLVCLAIIMSLFTFSKVLGLREGTVLSALIVGSISRFFISRFGFLEKFWIKPEESAS
jgi:uncharacterized protein